MRIGRWVIGIVGGLLLLVVAAILALVYLVDPNRFREPIQEAVSEATGRPFRFEGDLEIDWFPWLAVRTGPGQLGNPQGMSGPPLLQWRSASGGVRPFALIRGELIVDRVRLEGVKVHLQRSADGRANWEGLTGSDGATEEGGLPPRVGGIEIRDGALDYVDERSDVRLSLSDWQLEVSALEPGDPVRIETSLEFTVPRSAEETTESSQNEYTAILRLQTQAHIRPYSAESDSREAAAIDMNEVELRESQVVATLRGGELPQSGLPLELLAPRIGTALSPLRIEMPQWSMNVAQARLEGTLQAAADEAGDLRARGRAEAQVPSLKRFLAELGMEEPRPTDPEAMESLEIRAEWDYSGDVLSLQPLRARLDQTTLTGELTRVGGDPAAWTFLLRGDRIDLSRYTSAAEKKPDDEPFELPVETLRALRAQGELVFDEAKLADVTAKSLRLRVISEDDGAAAEYDSGGAPSAAQPRTAR